MILIAIRPEITLFLVLSTYIAASLAWNLYRLARGGYPAPVLKTGADKG
jgi:hypothetical protein